MICAGVPSFLYLGYLILKLCFEHRTIVLVLVIIEASLFTGRRGLLGIVAYQALLGAKAP